MSAQHPEVIEPDDRSDLARLVRRAQRGDAMAMDELLDHVAPYVGRLCGPIALEEAADAAQESLIAIFRGIHQLKEPNALWGWIRSIAVRESVRIATRGAAEDSELPDRRQLGDPEFLLDVHDLLGRLSPEHRAVLTLRHLDDRDEREVAAILDVPLGTVRSRLFRAKRNFRDAWD
jgi:RNA polymerase sigma factor (sigma-70 family)